MKSLSVPTRRAVLRKQGGPTIVCLGRTMLFRLIGKKLRRTFNRAKRSIDWETYRKALTDYNLELRRAKRGTFRTNCEGIEEQRPLKWPRSVKKHGGYYHQQPERGFTFQDPKK
jgi:hypothetical protein